MTLETNRLVLRPWKVTKTQELNPSLYKPLRFCEKYDIIF